tara:strand:+ start:163 stop:321 length:159 start_codon:yes stop_codon:yes gene_type:complete
MLKTRRYINSFIEVKTDELETTVYNKTQAEELRQNLLETIEDLSSFIEDCTD